MMGLWRLIKIVPLMSHNWLMFSVQYSNQERVSICMLF